MLSQLSSSDLDDLALGASLLGAGGGGDPFLGTLMARQAIDAAGAVAVVKPQELDPSALVVPLAMIGAPTVIVEKIPNGEEFVRVVEALGRYLDREVGAVMPMEVGGVNTLVPIAAAAELGLPLVDADGMRRAFPQLEQTVLTLAGIPATPIALADEKGDLVLFEATDNPMAEKLVRSTVVAMGGSAVLACYPLTAAQVAAHCIPASLTYALEIGRRLAAVQRGEPDAISLLLDYTGGEQIFAGKIVDLDRQTTTGFARGTVVLEHLGDATRMLRIEIQNENLVALEDGLPLATSPDLICIVDAETAQPITTEALGFGQRVHVLALPCAEQWRSEEGIELVGPRAFGYDLDYVPVGAPVGS